MNHIDSMFLNYFKELEGQDAITSEFGFLTYRISGNECYVHNLYITPEHRNNKRAKALFSSLKQRAKEAGATIITCNVYFKNAGLKKNIAIYKKQGFKKIQENTNCVTMLKEL